MIDKQGIKKEKKSGLQLENYCSSYYNVWRKLIFKIKYLELTLITHLKIGQYQDWD